jgi:hypothetical protein
MKPAPLAEKVDRAAEGAEVGCFQMLLLRCII